MTLAVHLADPYRRTHATRVRACEAAGGAFEAILAETILYPEGGGQPSDRGTVGGVAVLDVRRDDLGEIRHVLAGPVEAGAEVEIVLDWDRRFDHMQQHTAQHLLTALAHDAMNAPTVAFHLGAELSTIELDVPAFGPDRAEALEDLAAAEIRAARAVRVRSVDPWEIERLDVRTRGLPAGHVGPVRLVEIEGLDTNTCGGTHVASTAEIEAVRIAAVERIRGRVRLHFLAGGRVRAWGRTAAARERRLTELLNAGPAEHAGRVERLVEGARAAERERRRLLEELAAALGERLAAGPGGLVEVHRPEAEPGFLEAIARSVLEVDPGRLVLATGGPEAGEGVFLVAGPEDRVARAGPIVAAALGGRGGGRGGRFQGKASRLEGRTEAAAALRDLVS